MSIIRGVKDRRFKFTQLLNLMLEDQNLSLKAKGFIGYCLTKPPDWHFHMNHLTNVLKEGEKAIYSVINECIEQGYAYRYQPRNASGDFLSSETIISDSKEEIESIKKEIESSVDFKKYLPDRHFGDAVNAGAENVSLSNINSLPIGKTTTGAVVFFECLHQEIKNTKLSDEDKHALMKFPEDRIKLAIEYVNNPNIPIKRTPIAALVWHCTRPIPPLPPEDLTEQQKLAKSYTEQLSSLGLVKLAKDNEEVIKNNACFVLLNGQRVSVSLNNSIEVIKQDLRNSLSEAENFVNQKRQQKALQSC
jgi:hypothetical protein